MSWYPEESSEAFWLLVSPITTIPVLAYTLGFYAVDEDHPYGVPDWRKNVRNTSIWFAAAFGNWAYHAIVHPGKYSWTSGLDAFKWALHLAANPVVIGAGVATASAVAWAATGELHGAVPPGTASGIGMPMTPELYSRGTSSNPAGWDLGSWWSRLF